MTITIGFIGTGAIARTHAKILTGFQEVSLSKVYDISYERALAFSREFSTQAVQNIDEVFEHCDAVYITSPNKTHAGLTLSALKKKKHVFCEKPFALNLQDAEAIITEAEKANTIYQLGFNRRFAPAYMKMKNFICEQTLKPKSFSIKMNRGELQNPPWTSDASVTGGFLFESTLHLIDMVRYLFGEVKTIMAVGSKSVYKCVDNFSMILEMENGIHGVFSSCAHTSWIFPFERVEIYGEHASIFNDEMEKVHYTLSLSSPIISESYSTLPVEERWGYIIENRLFVDRILKKHIQEKLYADQRDGYMNVKLIENIYDKIGLGK